VRVGKALLDSALQKNTEDGNGSFEDSIQPLLECFAGPKSDFFESKTSGGDKKEMPCGCG